jgi:hypothetical protein
VNQVRQFLRLPRAEQVLVLRAALALAAALVEVAFLPFPALRRRLASRPPGRPGPNPKAPVSAERVGWAVAVASRYVPGASTCLVRAIAAARLLAREGYPSRIHIGVARPGPEGLAAHAWVTVGGRVVVGAAPGGPGYHDLLSFPESRP